MALAGHDGRMRVYFVVEIGKEHNTITEVSFDFDGVICSAND